MSSLQPATSQTRPASAQSSKSPSPVSAASLASYLLLIRGWASTLTSSLWSASSHIIGRWLALTTRALLWSGLATGLLSLWTQGAELSTFAWAALGGMAVFPVAVYPLLWVRRSFIVSPPQSTPSPSLITLVTSTFTSWRNLQLFAAHLVSGIVLAVLYSRIAGDSADMGFFTPTSRHPWHLNERFIFLVSGKMAFQAILASRDLLGSRIKSSWPTRRIPFAKAVKRELVLHLSIWELFVDRYNSVWTALAWPMIYSFGYMAFRKAVWRFAVTHTGSLLRPFIFNFMKSSRSNASLAMGWHLLLVELLSLAITKVPMAVMMAYITQPLNFDMFTGKSPLGADRYLLTALGSKSQYHLQFTLMELLRVSYIPARRQAIFKDISSSPNLTTELWQELLIQLGRVRHTVVSRGGSRMSVAAAPPASSAPRAPDSRTIPVRSADIFRPSVKPPSTLQKALKTVLDGPIRAPPQPVLKVQQLGRIAQEEAGKKVGEVQQQVLGRIEATPLGATVLSEAKGWNQSLWAWVGREWAKRSIQRSLPETVIAQRIIDILATLAVASIEEDTYGSVQHFLPATLEALVRYRSAIVSLGSEIVGQTSTMGQAGSSASATAQASLDAAISDCDRGIRKIADGFGSSLGAFKFPQGIAVELSEICRETSDE